MRERLLDAAEHLIARYGYEGASLRDIGARVGVSNATVLHHFGSKLELYRAVLDRFAIALRGLVDSVVADPEEDAPAALFASSTASPTGRAPTATTVSSRSASSSIRSRRRATSTFISRRESSGG